MRRAGDEASNGQQPPIPAAHRLRLHAQSGVPAPPRGWPPGPTTAGWGGTCTLGVLVGGGRATRATEELAREAGTAVVPKSGGGRAGGWRWEGSESSSPDSGGAGGRDCLTHQSLVLGALMSVACLVLWSSCLRAATVLEMALLTEALPVALMAQGLGWRLSP